jgi:LSD1 subclass zinc finger protein
MIKDHRQSRNTTDVSCATVHQFQGSERNVIIFDAVESCPATKVGWLMSKNEGGAVSRLINVAITRARGKFIAIANKTFWQNKVSSDNLFGSLVKHMSTEGHVLDHRDGALARYIADSHFGHGVKVFTSTAACNCDLLEDIRNAKSKIVLMIPPGSLNPDYAPLVLEELRKQADKKVTVAIIHDSSVRIPPAYEDLAIPSVKVTMPLLFVDGTVWYGLPIYRHAYSERQIHYPIHSDIMVRFSGKHTVNMIKSLAEYGSVKSPIVTGFALYTKNHLTCSECRKALMLCKGDRHYLRCSTCKKSYSVTPYTVNRYLDASGGKCPRCGRDQFAVRGRSEVFVKCAEDHIYKLDEI